MAGRISSMNPIAQLPGEAWLEVIVKVGSAFGNRRIDIASLREAIIDGQAESAYDLAVRLGFTGTEEDWIESLHGDTAYDIAVKYGFTGTEAEWLESLAVGLSVTPEDDGKALTTNGDITQWRFLNPADVGLANVDNTRDVDKPISTLQQTALDAKLDLVALDARIEAFLQSIGFSVDDTEWGIDQGMLPPV